MDVDMNRGDIVKILGDWAISHATMSQYSNLGLIAQPHRLGKGRGSQALYPPDTIEKIFAIRNLVTFENIPISKMKPIVDLGNYLEVKEYKSYREVINDEELCNKIGNSPRLAFLTYEYLSLKKAAHEELARNERHERYIADNPNSKIAKRSPWADLLGEPEFINSVIESPGQQVLPFVTQALLVAIANNDKDILREI